MTWSAQQYSRFEAERTRPVRDLVAAIPNEDVKTAVDLGCGPGNSTEVLAQRYPQARVTGLDSDQDMIAAARKRSPQTTFELADIAQWTPGAGCDVILANASLQWLPDHQTLYPRLVGCLAPNGTLAIQTPDNLQEPAHVLAQEVAADPRWGGKIAQVRQHNRHAPQWYYGLLQPLCQHIDVWRTTYFHPLENAQAVVEWFKGSALRPFLAKLDDEEKTVFLQMYKARIEQAYPALPSGTVLLPFPRLFILATR
ncbi:trans-aconitate 2-methyltransferase [Bordetella genomosp. 10]|uniref:Trans-aconitate 2-methyltransferase n=1 Tax=Bordetella genomosp. 10 TaxID=1416804 RepID=A0A261SA66_9BORD|nr:trans-aconitate 2-methyltransferase [Bordetella genomosp. 10]OZI34289.1 trans-aconitate 2-methyltransferase [Bordetella genomosp. 10]